MKPLIHCYVAFWRPEILTGIKATSGKCAALCEYVGPSTDFTCAMADVTCEACRHNFLEGMPTGNGTKITWDEYVKRDRAAASNRTLKERAAELDKNQWVSSTADAWSTDATINPALPTWKTS